MLFNLFRRNMLYLSDVPKVCSTIPGTINLRIAESTAKKYEDTIRRFQEWLRSVGLPDNPAVKDITRQQYSDFHDWLDTRGTAAITTNGYRKRMRAMWNELRERGHEVCNIDGITKTAIEPYQRDKAITDKHLTQILQIAKPRDTAMIMYMWQGGFRRQTVPRLRLDNTHIWQNEEGQFRVVSAIPKEKTSKPRMILAGNKTAIAIQNWLNVREFQDSEWLFYEMSNGEQIKWNSIGSVFYKLRIRANIPGWSNVSAHGFRHRFAHDKLSEHDQRVVADWMGISVKTLLQTYAARSADKLMDLRYQDGSYPNEVANLVRSLK